MVIVQTYLEIDGYARYKVPPVSFRPRTNLLMDCVSNTGFYSVLIDFC